MGKTCQNCLCRHTCWLRLDMNEIAVKAQTRGLVGGAWLLYEQIAEDCKKYAEDKEMVEG